MQTRTVMSLMAGLLALGCSTTSSGPDPAPEYSLAEAADSVPLRVGRETRVATLWLTLSGVSADSRCPSDVVCVWAGDAVAEIQADPPCIKDGCRAASAAFSLHTNGEPRSGDYFGYRIRLVALQPYPVSTRPIKPRDYVAWVRVTPAP